jgi:endonuclease YncB( thermonuclease family)
MPLALRGWRHGMVPALLFLQTTGTWAEDIQWTDVPVRVNQNTQHLERLPDRSLSRGDEQPSWINLGKDVKAIDSATFQSGGKTYRLVGIRGLEPNSLCRDKQGHKWACGVRGRATLRSLLIRLYTRCALHAVEQDVKGGDAPVGLNCHIAGDINLAAYLLSQGLASSSVP